MITHKSHVMAAALAMALTWPVGAAHTATGLQTTQSRTKEQVNVALEQMLQRNGARVVEGRNLVIASQGGTGLYAVVRNGRVVDYVVMNPRMEPGHTVMAKTKGSSQPTEKQKCQQKLVECASPGGPCGLQHAPPGFKDALLNFEWGRAKAMLDENSKKCDECLSTRCKQLLGL